MMCFDNAFTVFAGPNGGGKSSLVYSLWKGNPSAPYVCADSIAKEAPICGIQNSDQRNLAAMVKAQEIVNDRLLKRLSVAYETVLSSDYKWGLFELAIKNEMPIYAYYVTTCDPLINVRRVKRRVLEGGHDVPEDKIISRYHRSHANLGKLLTLCRSAYVFDSSKENEPPALVLYKSRNTLLFHEEIAMSYAWLSDLRDSWVKDGLFNIDQYCDSL